MIDRRLVLAGLAVASAAPALGQQGGAARAAMGPAEMQHAQDTMRLGTVALETSRIAQEKAGNADLKRFAEFEIQEQQTIAEVLRAMMDPGATAATGSSAPAAMGTGAVPMDAHLREMIQKTQQASGAEFDRLYLDGQLQGHRDLLQVQERYLQANPQNRDHSIVAKLARGQIRQHIALLEDLQRTIR